MALLGVRHDGGLVWRTPGLTFHRHVDARGQEEPSEAVVEDLVCLQRCRRVVRDFNTWKKIIIS